MTATALAFPVGTVVYSMLDEATFQAQMGTGQTWVLADGRSLAGQGTLYESVTHSASIPNLLGVFVRGKNNGRADGNQNPDGDLPLGQFTADRFAQHSHGGTTLPDSPDHTHGFGGYGFGVNYGNNNGTANLGVPVNNFHVNTEGASTRHTHPIHAEGGSDTAPKSVTLNPFIRIN
jgi:hypothetical protein